ncbi:MAG: hypothetical protein GDA49_05765 [Rhodospirillales bacterium]|nr:hypothetical protein [Rhodospirillales bacterium]
MWGNKQLQVICRPRRSRCEILFDLAVAAEHVHKLEPNGGTFMAPEKTRFNLLRIWADT